MVDEYIWLCTRYIVYLTCNIYMYKIVLGEFALCRWRRCIPRNFGEKQSGRRLSLDQQSVIEWVKNFFLFPFYNPLKMIVCNFSSKLVTPDPRLQGCLILNNIWISKVYNNLKEYFYQKNIKREAAEYVAWCFTCQ